MRGFGVKEGIGYNLCNITIIQHEIYFLDKLISDISTNHRYPQK